MKEEYSKCLLLPFINIFLFFFLVPDNAENEGDALLQFTAEFSSRLDL